VDLGALAAVSSVVVWNRTDCCGSRLNDYWCLFRTPRSSPRTRPPRYKTGLVRSAVTRPRLPIRPLRLRGAAPKAGMCECNSLTRPI
jgi:hypothetical protein